MFYFLIKPFLPESHAVTSTTFFFYNNIGEWVKTINNTYVDGFISRFVRSGPNQWRDCQTPKQILDDWCEKQHMAKPQYLGNTQLALESKIYNLQEFGECFTGNLFKEDLKPKTNLFLFDYWYSRLTL